MIQLTPTLIIEFAALIFAWSNYGRLKKGRLRTLPYFLLFICMVEVTGNIIKNSNSQNALLYNISTPIEYSFYQLLFFLHLNNKFFPRIFILFLWLISVVNFFLQPAHDVHFYVLWVGSIEVIFLCCYYIYEQFIDEESDKVLYKNYFFWIVAGLLLFNLGEAIFFGFYKFMDNGQREIFGPLFSAINNNLLLVLYFCFIISILTYSKFNKPVYAQ